MTLFSRPSIRLAMLIIVVILTVMGFVLETKYEPIQMTMLQSLFILPFAPLLLSGAVGIISCLGFVFGLGMHIVSTLTHPKKEQQFIPVTPFVLDLPAEEVSFPDSGGKHEVNGLYIPHPEATTTILICPGYRRSLADVLGMCKHLWQAQHNVLAFEYFGHGKIVGTPVTLGYREVDDFLGAVTYAKRRAPRARLGAIGYSMGASTAIMGTARTQEVEALVADSGFATQWSAVALSVRRTLRIPLPSWFMWLLYHVTDLLLWWRAGYHFHQVEPTREIRRIAPRPLLIIHGLNDTVVSSSDAQKLYNAANEPKDLWLLDETEHIRAYFTDSVTYTTKILDFFEHSLQRVPREEALSLSHLLSWSVPIGSVSGLNVSRNFSSQEGIAVPLQYTHRDHSSIKGEQVIEQLLSKKKVNRSKQEEIRLRQLMRTLRLRYATGMKETTTKLHQWGLVYGDILYRFRWPIILLWLVIILASVPFAQSVANNLQNTGYVITNSESGHVDQILTGTLQHPVSELLLVFQSRDTPVSTPLYQQELHMVVTKMRTFPHVTLVSQEATGRDGRTTVVTLGFNIDQDQVGQRLPDIRAQLPYHPTPAQISITGAPAVANEIQLATQSDSEHAEMIAMPLTLLVLLVVFGSVVASLLPLILAAITVPVALAILDVIAMHVNTNIFVMNVTSIIGLGLSIDYSLFLVRRFREELAQGRGVRDAVAWTVTMAGEAVLFSGLNVIIGFAGLFWIGIPVMVSFGLGGVIVAAIAVLGALTLLPALLSVIGMRIHAWQLPRLKVFRPSQMARVSSSGKLHAQKANSGFWHSWAVLIMKRPLIVIMLSTVVLLGLGWPALSLHPGLPGASELPLHSEARQGLDVIDTQFPQFNTDPLSLVVQTHDGSDMLSSSNITRLQRLLQWVVAQPHVTHVLSLMTLPDEVGTPHLSPPQLEMLYRTGKYQHIPSLTQLAKETTKGNVTLITVQSNAQADGRDMQDLVDHLRRHIGDGFDILVGGTDATGIDFNQILYGNLKWALLFIVVSTYLLLLFMFRSILLPLKAIVMNILSIAASYGALVFVFQQGHFQDQLNFSANGSIDRFVPVLLCCVLFGLSMDYEVFLLSRVREEWLRTRDNTVAVARGLQMTGGVITNAALLFMIVASAFVLTELIITKELGLSITIAVFVDATLIRSILVPATMRLMGKWNWWMPWSSQTTRKAALRTSFQLNDLIQTERRNDRVFITRKYKNTRRSTVRYPSREMERVL